MTLTEAHQKIIDDYVNGAPVDTVAARHKVTKNYVRELVT